MLMLPLSLQFYKNHPMEFVLEVYDLYHAKRNIENSEHFGASKWYFTHGQLNLNSEMHYLLGVKFKDSSMTFQDLF